VERYLLVFVDSLLESMEVELISNEILADFTEEVMIFDSTEPLNPSHIDVLAEL
jgi:hypothetical protein